MQAISTLGNVQSRRDSKAPAGPGWLGPISGGAEASPCRSPAVPPEDEGRPTKTTGGNCRPTCDKCSNWRCLRPGASRRNAGLIKTLSPI